MQLNIFKNILLKEFVLGEHKKYLTTYVLTYYTYVGMYFFFIPIKNPLEKTIKILKNYVET